MPVCFQLNFAGCLLMCHQEAGIVCSVDLLDAPSGKQRLGIFSIEYSLKLLYHVNPKKDCVAQNNFTRMVTSECASTVLW